MGRLAEDVGGLVLPEDTILDVGCGIMNHTLGLGRAVVGIDCYQPYADHLAEKGIGVIVGEAAITLRALHANSFDVVLLLHSLEHMGKTNALDCIRHAQRIARRMVFVDLPEGKCEQDGWAPWGLGHNPAQRHLSTWERKDLELVEMQVTHAVRGGVPCLTGVWYP